MNSINIPPLSPRRHRMALWERGAAAPGAAPGAGIGNPAENPAENPAGVYPGIQWRIQPGIQWVSSRNPAGNPAGILPRDPVCYLRCSASVGIGVYFPAPSMPIYRLPVYGITNCLYQAHPVEL